jgi:Chaperone of endosialidase
LIAEQAAEINPDLVVRDQKGEIYTMRYDAVNAMLLNEFLKDTAIGYGALDAQMSGDFNTALGLFAGNGVTTASNVICIGTSGANVNDSCYVGNIWTQPGGSQAVYVNSDGKLGAQVSSQRFKEDIHPMEEASATLYRLKPVTFRYKKEIDRRGMQQLGLVAEEVAVVNPDLVIRDKEGKPYSVRYDQVNAMLLNEFLKEHRAFIEEQRKMAEQQKEIDALKAELREQKFLIQKVSDKMELSESVTKVATHYP